MAETLKPFVAKLVEMLRGREELDPTFHAIIADWLEERGDPRPQDLRLLHVEEVMGPKRPPVVGTRRYAWAVQPGNGSESIFADRKGAICRLIRRAIDMLAMPCPTCKGRPWNVSVELAEETLATQARRPAMTRISVEPWDLREGDELAIDEQIGRVFKMPVSRSYLTVILTPLGRIVGIPEPCHTCDGLGVVPLEAEWCKGCEGKGQRREIVTKAEAASAQLFAEREHGYVFRQETKEQRHKQIGVATWRCALCKGQKWRKFMPPPAADPRIPERSRLPYECKLTDY